MEAMQHFKTRMRRDLREYIVRDKLSVLTPEKQTSMYSGYSIYKAFIDEGIIDFERVTRNLIECGIQMVDSQIKIIEPFY
jgi:hypothetical protein